MRLCELLDLGLMMNEALTVFFEDIYIYFVYQKVYGLVPQQEKFQKMSNYLPILSVAQDLD